MKANHNNVKNEVIMLLLDQIQPNKQGHLIVERSKHCIFQELRQAGFLETLYIHGHLVDVAYNYTLISFFKKGGFA